MEPSKDRKTSDHLANERTFLAWIRTGIGIMAFGFVVVKFSLFLKQLTVILGKSPVMPARGFSSVIGIALVGLGLLTTAFAYWRFKRTQREIESSSYQSSSLAISVLVGLILAFAVVLIVYLVENT